LLPKILEDKKLRDSIDRDMEAAEQEKWKRHH